MPPNERGSRAMKTSLRSWSTSMSSFCQYVELVEPGNVDGGSPVRRSASLSSVSSLRGCAGSARSYVIRPKRPVAIMMSRSLEPFPYCRKLIAVAYLASGKLAVSSMFLRAPAGCSMAAAGAASTSSAPTAAAHAEMRRIGFSPLP